MTAKTGKVRKAECMGRILAGGAQTVKGLGYTDILKIKPAKGNAMQSKKPVEIIASQYKLSIESAKYFLGRVQKTFKKKKPPQAMIIEFMHAQQYAELPKPYQVAKLMHDSGVWPEAIYGEPPEILEDEDDLYFSV
jgi:hypothetical protein